MKSLIKQNFRIYILKKDLNRVYLFCYFCYNNRRRKKEEVEEEEIIY